jgi:hypothetical protein
LAGDKTWCERRMENRYRNRDPTPTPKLVKNTSGKDENQAEEKNCSQKTKSTDRSSNEGRPRTQEGNSYLDAIQTRMKINSNEQCITQPKGELLRSSKIKQGRLNSTQETQKLFFSLQSKKDFNSETQKSPPSLTPSFDYCNKV